MLGYDISEIATYAGWGRSTFAGTNRGRATQGYSITVTFVNSTTATFEPATTWVPNPDGDNSRTWSYVIFQMSDNGTLLDNGVTLTGVKAIKFADFVPPPVGGSNKYHEIDIYGTATVPEPSARCRC